ncbi:MAG: nicotinate-nucleotide--dimethylbenzimidazole phosphoribosyltransferase [bacterium]|nr:nicotinate-nucleotide--dimethylbenzimidazole phosphoribosyltransferase [bacterium]
MSTSRLELLREQIQPMDRESYERAKRRWDAIAKPLHSLGLLEEAIAEIAGMTQSESVFLEKAALLICCADNGVVEEGVTQTGQEVTAVVTANFTRGSSCVCLMAERCGVSVIPVDLGVAKEWKDEELGSKYPLRMKKIAMGTKNFVKEAAMTRKEAEQAIFVGVELVKEQKERGTQILAVGEMGIGNTTSSSAVASVLLGKEAARMTGRGAGLSDAGLQRKIQVIEQAIHLHNPDYRDPVDVLAKVGGLDLAGMMGIFLGAALYRLPVVMDGFISAAAALLACSFHPAVKDYLLASHVSAEPAALEILTFLGKKAPIQAHLSLGEGTGAVAALPLYQMAARVYEQMTTFEENEIEAYHPL